VATVKTSRDQENQESREAGWRQAAGAAQSLQPRTAPRNCAKCQLKLRELGAALAALCHMAFQFRSALAGYPLRDLFGRKVLYHFTVPTSFPHLLHCPKKVGLHGALLQPGGGGDF
jgi:hypothetical protein